MFTSTQLVAILIGLAISLCTLELVRERKLKEQYALLWMAASVMIVVLAVFQELLAVVSNLIGALDTRSTLFFFGFVFVVLVLLQYAVTLSRFSVQIKSIVQDLALLKEELQQAQRLSQNACMESANLDDTQGSGLEEEQEAGGQQ